jgi:hypothetical protein
MCPDLPIWGANICPLFSGKSCVLENIHKKQNWLKTMINNASSIFLLLRAIIALLAINLLWNDLLQSPYLLSSC